MATPTWQSPLAGQATLVGHANQFLSTHASSIAYDDNAIGSSGTPTVGSTADTLSGSWYAEKFTVSLAYYITRVNIALGAIGAGADVVLALMNDSGGGVPGTVLWQAVIPAEWLPSGVQTAYDTFSVPMNYPTALSTGTNYYLAIMPGQVLQGSGAPPANNALWQALAAIDDVELTRSTESSNGFFSTNGGSSWSSRAYGYAIAPIGYYSLGTGQSGKLRTFGDDFITVGNGSTPQRESSFGYSASNVLTSAYNYAMHALSPWNLLSRNDAAFVTSTGGWVAANNCTIARDTSVFLYGPASLKVTSVSSGSYMLANTGEGTWPATYYPVTAGTTYTAAASFRAATSGRSCNVWLFWYNSSGTLLSSNTGSNITDTTTGWTQAFLSVAAPTNAAYAIVGVQILSPGAANEVHHVDCVQLQQGTTNTAWGYPGTGVASARALSYSGGLLSGVA